MTKGELDIITFVYAYQITDPEIIKKEIPEAEKMNSEDIFNLIEEDWEKLNREIKYETRSYEENKNLTNQISSI